MEKNLINYCSNKTNIEFKKIEKTLNLLVEEKCTVPFIARYRKEATGNLTETDIRQIELTYNEYTILEKRRYLIPAATEK